MAEKKKTEDCFDNKKKKTFKKKVTCIIKKKKFGKDRAEAYVSTVLRRKGELKEELVGKKALPFEEMKLNESISIRKFSETISEGELVWHRDREPRKITVLEDTNWSIELDGHPPLILEKNEEFFIPRGQYHRVIKGSGPFMVKIEKMPSNYRHVIEEAEYRGKKVQLGKPKRGGSKKFYVYVRCKGKVRKISFGSKGMALRISEPKRRKSFVARHKCKQKKDRCSAGYWSCRIGRYPNLTGAKSKYTWW